MAAAYQTGVSSSPINLLQTLVTWLVAQGWTSEASASEGAGWRSHLSKGGLFVNLRAAANEKIWPAVAGNWDFEQGYGIGLNLATAYSGASGWAQQANAPVRTDGSSNGCGMNLPSGAVSAYHFFDDGNDNVAVVVERAPGIFTHMGWGPDLAPLGQAAAYPYFFAATGARRNVDVTTQYSDKHGINVTALPPFSHADKEPSTSDFVDATVFVRVDAALWSGRWLSDSQAPGSLDANYGFTGRVLRCAANLNPLSQGQLEQGEYPNYRFLDDRLLQSQVAGAVLLPLHLFGNTASDRWSPLGAHPSIFLCEGVGSGYAAGELYSVGGVDYLLFPHFVVRKDA